MTKFIKKYRNILLIGFAAFLLVAFLVPQALQEFGRSGLRQTAVTIDGKNISNEQAMEIVRRSKAAQSLVSLGGPENSLLRLMLGVDDQSGGEGAKRFDWAVASRDAEIAGFVGDPGAGMAAMGLFSQQMLGLVQQQLLRAARSPEEFQRAMTTQEEALKARFNQAKTIGLAVDDRRIVPGREVARGLAEAEGMIRMRDTFFTAPVMSESRLIAEARRRADRVTADVIVINTDNALAAEGPEPDEVALQNFFEKYRNVTAGSGDTAWGFRNPDRFKLEWIKIDRLAVRNSIRVRLDDVLKRIDNDDATLKRAGQTVPARTDEETRALRARVTDRLRDEAVAQFLREAEEAIAAQRAQAIKALPQDEMGYRTLPADWDSRRITPEAMVQAVVDARLRSLKQAAALQGRAEETATLDVPAPTVGRPDADGLMTTRQIIAIDGLGFSTVGRDPDRARNRPFTDYLSSIMEIAGKQGRGAATTRFQVGLPAPESARDFTGNVYYFIVTQAAKAGPPATLAEVRDQVVKAFRQDRAFQALQTQTPALVAEALSHGGDLKTVADRLSADLKTTISVSPGVTVSGLSGVTPASVAGGDKALVDALLARAIQLDPTKPIADADPSTLVVGVTLPKQNAVAIARITGYSPVTREMLQNAGPQFLQTLAQERAAELRERKSDPFSPERIEARRRVVHAGEQKPAAPSPAGTGTPSGTGSAPSSSGDPNAGNN